MATTLHKVTIEVDERLWRAFKGQVAQRDARIQRELGRLVEKEARAAEQRERRRLAKSKVFDRLVAELEGEPQGRPARTRTRPPGRG